MGSGPPAGMRVVRAALTVAVSAGLLLWSVSQVDTVALRALLVQMRWPFLLGAAALGPVQVWMSAARWRRVSAALGLALPERRAVAELYLATCLNQVLPSGVAGDALRVVRHGKRQGALVGALHAAVVERYAGQLVLALVAVASVIGVGDTLPEGLALAVVGVCVLLFALLLLPHGLPLLGGLAQATRRALGGPGGARIWGLSAALLLSFLGAMCLCAVGLGVALSGPLIGGFVLVLLAMAVPISVGGWGLREAAAAALLPVFGLSQESALAVSVAYGLSVLLGALPGALVPLLPQRVFEVQA